jgi:glycosyltransferase involved in cell wall biosynthesis
MMPRVSVIVPAYNAAVYLPYAIDSVLAQTLSGLGNRNRGRRQHRSIPARSWIPTGPSLREKLQYIYQANRGLPAARNTGIRAARGEFIALLDADDVWLPQRLERGVQALDADPSIGLVHARVMPHQTRRVHYRTAEGRNQIHVRKDSAEYLYAARPHRLSHGHVPQKLPGNRGLVRRSACRPPKTATFGSALPCTTRLLISTKCWRITVSRHRP